jgi:hypothetical protein
VPQVGDDVHKLKVEDMNLVAEDKAVVEATVKSYRRDILLVGHGLDGEEEDEGSL